MHDNLMAHQLHGLHTGPLGYLFYLISILQRQIGRAMGKLLIVNIFSIPICYKKNIFDYSFISLRQFVFDFSFPLPL